jgi:hypothetical protein
MAILEIVRDILQRKEQVVIACARKGQTDTLHVALREAGVKVGRIDSTVPAERHSHESNLFKAGKTQVLLFGIKCAASYSFSDCPNMIIGSLEYSYGSLEQAKGRVDRVNSKKPATIYVILNSTSIEEVMHDVVAVKEDAACLCLRGQRTSREYKPVDLSEVLAQAITGFKKGNVSEMECEAQWPRLRQSIRSIS